MTLIHSEVAEPCSYKHMAISFLITGQKTSNENISDLSGAISTFHSFLTWSLAKPASVEHLCFVLSPLDGEHSHIWALDFLFVDGWEFATHDHTIFKSFLTES